MKKEQEHQASSGLTVLEHWASPGLMGQGHQASSRFTYQAIPLAKCSEGRIQGKEVWVRRSGKHMRPGWQREETHGSVPSAAADLAGVHHSKATAFCTH